MEHEDIPELINEQASNSANSDDDEDFSDVDEEMETVAVQCLFCKQQLSSVEIGIEHLSSLHSIDFHRLKFKFHMDQYSFLKLINCIRWENVTAERILAAKEPFWNDEKYLKPKEYEAWLSYDYDEMPLLAEADSEAVNINDASATQSLNVLKEKVRELEQLLEQASEDMTKMRKGFQRLLEKEKLPSISIKNGKVKALNSVAALSAEADSGYFSSYAHFGIHHEMLSDVVRTTSYRDALFLNKPFVSGKDVLDVGCGTSVLSIFASQAGAKNVIGIDNSDIIYNAMDILKQNDINNVTLVKGRLEDTTLPQEKFDIIISEWMGYFLLFEGMLDSIIYARDTHLREDGVLLPNRCTMSIVGYGNETLYKQQVTFWDNVYDLNMSNMKKEVLHEPLIDVVDAQHILTESNLIADLNLRKVDLNYSNFSYQLNLNCTKNGELSAFVGYFDTYFDLPVPVMFSTSPNNKPTHWKQVVFFLEHPQKVKAGDIIIGNLICRRSRNSARSLDITIEAFGKKYSYYLD
ncbi:protein arginine N-methyltransferase 1-like [Rhagoletis pomonella]|uniref:protein arginine N-methyltransferase 1-like n=1 Tax=Rhagoletis pomonella TaxID=28610 RepID=UPI00178561B1|nr:protein arginine N-methyltransferase 1-like [Rhagoletis pomonella]